MTIPKQRSGQRKVLKRMTYWCTPKKLQLDLIKKLANRIRKEQEDS